MRVKIGEFEFEILLDTTARPYLLKNNSFIWITNYFCYKFLFWHNCNGFSYVSYLSLGYTIHIDTNLKELIINRVFGCKASYPSYCFADLDCIV